MNWLYLFSVSKRALPKVGWAAALLFFVLRAMVSASERCPRCAAGAQGGEVDSAHQRVVHIRPGLSCIQIIRLLRQAGVVRSTVRFSVALLCAGKWRDLKAGTYCFRNDINDLALVQVLTEGRVMVHRICIPEGWSIAQVLQCVQEHPCLLGEAPVNLAEGSILPGTYWFTDGQTRQQCVALMQQGLQDLLERVCTQPLETQRTPAAVVIMASIVEKETSVAEEKPVIAGVFWNRLRLGMRLQADPTVIYALQLRGAWRPPLRRSDLRLPSPYNTYCNRGLPPAPICCPGKGSIIATAGAPPTVLLYFNATNNHSHLFASSLKEHNRNVQRVKQGK